VEFGLSDEQRRHLVVQQRTSIGAGGCKRHRTARPTDSTGKGTRR
jgi:hypothetical protein